MKSAVDAGIARTIQSTAFILGPEAEAFEREFAAFSQAAHCVGCANGTDAIELALRGLGVQPGDEVITAANTFIATSEAISNTGARPVFVDVRDDTLLMDATLIAPAISKRTRAIIPVHLYGQPVDMDPLLALAHERNLVVIEDAAQAHGATDRGRGVGTMGDAGTFSFYPGKNLGAYGDAGAIVTRRADLASWLAMARNHGRAAKAKYAHDFQGRNSRLDGLQAAVLRAKLPFVAAWNEQRRAIALEYDRAFRGESRIKTVHVRPETHAVFHLYPIRVADREGLQKHLAERGIETGVHYPIPLHLQPAYAYLELKSGSFPVAEAAAETMLSLPMFAELSVEAAREVAAAVLDFVT